MLPMRPGQSARRSHDYTRHGTISLFAALDIATGRVIGKCYGRHRAAEFRKFLDDRTASKAVHGPAIGRLMAALADAMFRSPC
jgi:hypothetical protein